MTAPIMNETMDLARPLAASDFLHDVPDCPEHRCGMITEYIARNFNRDIRLAEVALVADMRVTSFCAFFKEHYQHTFTGYVNQLRIDFACGLLREKQKSIAQVIMLSGFDSQANFNRQFKRLTGKTPMQFRQEARLFINSSPSGSGRVPGSSWPPERNGYGRSAP